MPLKTLVVIALRLFAIYWFVESISEFLGFIPLFWAFQKQMDNSVVFDNNMAALVIPGIMLFIAIAIWISASRLSVKVTQDCDTQLAVTNLTREDFYAFAFVFLGLFFVLSSIPSALANGYKFCVFDYPLEDGNPQKGKYLWPFLSHVAVLIVGFACIFGASQWTKKLLRLENKSKDSSDASTTT